MRQAKDLKVKITLFDWGTLFTLKASGMTMNKPMQKVILITGAASGLGWALTQRYHAKEYLIVMVDIQVKLLAERELSLNNPDTVFSADCDITDAKAIEHLAMHVQQQFGRLDVLINNAGITHRSLVEKTDPHVFRKVMAVDYQGPVELTLALLDLLKSSKGTIINVSSMAGWMPVLGRAGYCAAKSALHQFFEVMRCEVRHHGVKILMVYPSFLDTPIETNALGHDGNKAMHTRSIVGGMGSADTVAGEIITAHSQGKERLFPNKFTLFASIVYRIFPSVFLRGMTKKFASELES
ncbi:MAG: dehydrogenase/reductase SDR family protein 7B [Oceanicoccus sp.]